MNDLYRFCSDAGNAQYITLLLLGFFFVCWASWVYTNAKQTNLPLTTLEWWQIYGSGTLALLCGSLFMGFVMVPENAEKLVEILYVKEPLDWLTMQVRSVLMWLVGLGM